MGLELVLAICIGAFFHSAVLFAVAYFSLKPLVAGAKRSLFACFAALAFYAGWIVWQLFEAGWQVRGESVGALVLAFAIYGSMTCLWGWRTYESDRREGATSEVESEISSPSPRA